VLQGNFWLFAAGSIGVGVHNAFWQFLRFAATEAVGTDNRAKAVSFVVMGGVIAALLGPWLATHSRELFAPAMFAGCYVALSGVCAVNILLLQLAQFDKTIATTSTGNGRPLHAIVRQPAFVTAAMSAAIGYGVMILVMTATPLAMVGCGFTFTDAAFVIQWHVAGMYAPSFFTGRLIDRFGAERVIGTGVLLIVATMCANLSGLALQNFWAGLVCLGVGWNFMYVGGSTLLTQAWRPEERARVQALNEFLVFTVVAAASLSSGILFSAVGWHIVNAVLVLPLLFVLVVLCRPILQQKFAARLTTN
jgi:predicted MFS family arabinose efflux permease